MKYIIALVVAMIVLWAILLVIPNKVTYIAPVYAEEVYRSPNIKVYAFEQVLNKWSDEQWVYFSELIKRESRWKSEAQNPNSSAYGLGQFLNGTWDDVGCKKTSDPYTQIDCTIKYIEQRYKTPKKAIEFHNKHNSY